jgi:deoxyribonuclease-4
MIKLGSHIKFKSPNYLIDSIEESIENKANTMMIYLGPPQSTIRANISKYKLEEYKEKYKNIIKPEDIIVHAPYITNLANPEKKNFACEFLIKEIERMNYIGAKYLIIHPGSHTKFTRKDSIKTLIESLKYIFINTKNVEILIETMSGKGTEIGAKFEEIKYIIDKVNNSRLNVCLDTCHI